MPYSIIICHNSCDSLYIDNTTTNPIHLSYKADKKAYRAQLDVELLQRFTLPWCIVKRSQSRGKMHLRCADRQLGNIYGER